jgi:HD-GYP domain-containing protein (c-di-GMP phosphodiesterase class II)
MDTSFFIKQNMREKARKFIYQFITALKSIRLYPSNYQPLLDSLDNLYDTLLEAVGREKEITFNIIGEEIIFIDAPLIPMTKDEILYRQFVDELRDKNITGICLRQGLQKEELNKFIFLMSKDVKILFQKGGLAEVLDAEDIRNITVHRVIVAKASEEKKKLIDGLFSHEKREKGRKIFFEGIETIGKVMEKAKAGEKFNLRGIQQIIHMMIDNIFLDKAVLEGLTAIKNYDEYTYNHSVNVAIFSLAMGAELSLNRTQLSSLGVAAILHDVGKVRIPTAITQKPGILTEEEWKIVKNHPIESLKILSDMGEVDTLAMVVAFENHIGYDLRGYPKVKELRELHIFSQIVSIADFYDATTTFRIYHKPLLPDKAVAMIINKRGTYFDPFLVKVFVNMIGVFPIGTLVRLDSDELGVVYRINRENLFRPKVIIVQPGDNRPIEELDASSFVDLIEIDEQTRKFKKTIVETLEPVKYSIDVTKYF